AVSGDDRDALADLMVGSLGHAKKLTYGDAARTGRSKLCELYGKAEALTAKCAKDARGTPRKPGPSGNWVNYPLPQLAMNLRAVRYNQ
ncbi:MAG: hypothetical protein WA859_20670, partial [Candidatus Sulfotelmatobacter sp.]